MDFLFGPFTDNEFLRLSLVATCIVATTCAIAGVFVVLRGLAFVGDALAHGVVPGVAIALLAGFSGVLGAAIGAAVMMGGVGIVNRRFRLSNDTAIGLLFVGMLSLGVIIQSRSESFAGDLTAVLFGEVLGITWSDVMWQVVALVVVAGTAWTCRRPFLLLSFDEGLAATSGFSVRRYANILLAMVALTVVASFQTVGTLLVLGMLVAPAATGALFGRRISTVVAIAAAVGVASSYVGLLLSYHADLAASASIVLTAVVVFALAASVVEIRRWLDHRRDIHHLHDHPHFHEHVHH
ncbi:MAG: metal ABC transporter permease [Actinobacteria bacterium]|nr:metal ABC transporter permease [Actinomycetota bacterium]NBP52898.1 metal ABC transporter permease [Actinomycetota bacterium]